jgi:hypothetical protein
MTILPLDGDKSVAVPKDVAVCPECKAELTVEIMEWGTEDGRCDGPGAFNVSCTREDDGLAKLEAGEIDERLYYSDYQERGWQSDWQPVIDRVGRWLEANVRVEVKRV